MSAVGVLVRKACDRLEAAGVLVSGSTAVEALYEAVVRACERASGEDDIEAVIGKELKRSEPWRRFHSELIDDMHEALYGGRAPEHVVRETLDACNGADDIAECLKRAKGGDAVEARAPAAVDEAWIDEFVRAYGRHPHVHEYVHLRDAGCDLSARAEAHRKACDEVRDVYSRYLDQCLSEADFVRTYLLRSVNEPELGASVMKWAVDRPEYAAAMKKRISTIHSSLTGEGLPDEEIAHVFEAIVFPKALPLDTDELNGVVRNYISEGNEITSEIQKVFDVYLGRAAECAEVKEWHFTFRVDSSARENMRRYLVSSLEFHHVLAETIRRERPDMPVARRFAVLHSVLECESDLLGARDSEDFVRILDDVVVRTR
jgi:hypothetical protein